MVKHKLAPAFHALGLYTFPVHYIKTGDGKGIKKPSVKWRNTPMPDYAAEYQNYGIRLDSRYVVVDVDVKHGKQGAATWLKMRGMLSEANQALIDDFSNRLQCATMTGGRHHWFKLPPGVTIQKNPAGFDDVDFLSEGAYVVGPGTYFETGTPYAILAGAIDDEYIPMYPREWLIATMKRETEYRAPDKDFTNTAVALRQFTQYCESAPPAIAFTNGDNTTLKTAMAARDLGIDRDHCFDIMWKVFNPRCQPVWDEGAMDTIVANAYAYAKGGAGAQDYSHLLLDADGQADLDESLDSEGYKWNIKANGHPAPDDEHNIICYLTAPNNGEFKNALWGIFRYNAFSDRPEYTVAPPWYNPATAVDDKVTVPREIDDAELGNCKHYLFQRYGYRAERKTIYSAIDFVSRQATYHPIRSWLKSLVWDGIPRLDAWLPAYCGTEDNTYTQVIGPKVLIGAVSRIMEPGCKMDYTLVLEGEQGTGKSAVCEILGMKREWYAGISPGTDKDTRAVLSRKWIVELAELDTFRGHEASAIKAFMTTANDTYRVPYKQFPQDFPRQSIFIGTVNPGASYEYLNDPTGARRFWPVTTGAIDLPALERNVVQMWAEAVHRYKAGELRYVRDEFQEILKAEVKSRQYIDTFVEGIKEYWEANPELDVVNIQWLAVNACHVKSEFYDKRARRRMIEALTHLDWKITGNLKQNARPPARQAQEDDFSRFIQGAAESVKELRQGITKRSAFTYAYLSRRWELGPLTTSMKHRLSHILRQHGVETDWDAKERTTKIVFEPLSVEDLGI